MSNLSPTLKTWCFAKLSKIDVQLPVLQRFSNNLFFLDAKETIIELPYGTIKFFSNANY